jgi:hypothetical protein
MKKGAIALTLENIIGLILAAILIPALIFFVVSIAGLISTTPDQSTVNSFDALILTINQLVNASGDKEIDIVAYPDKKIIPSSGNSYQVVIPYSLQDDFGIVAFDKEQITQRCGTGDPDLEKPAQCLKLPCLCMVRLDATWKTSFGGIDPVFERCETVKKVKSISATPESSKSGNYGLVHETGAGGNNLVLWSECDPDPDFGVKNIKIVRLPVEEGAFNLLFDVSPIKRT